MISNKFLFFLTDESFKNKLDSGEIDYRSIAFIKDKQHIWTHGTIFSGSSNTEVLTQSQYDSQVHEKDKIYFIIPGEGNWSFGDTFPITF